LVSIVSEIVGRKEELSRLREFAGESPAALALQGEAGIGKSTLWLVGVELARAHGAHVLAARPAEAERDLANAGLADLLERVLEDALPALAPPRRRALEAALLLEEAPGAAVDHRAVSVAVRDVLQNLTETAPLLVAIDDVQWLDPSSAAALGFALRRLGDRPVSVLLARRLEQDAPPTDLERMLEKPVRTLRVGPLTVGALHQLLRDRLGRPFPRQTLLRIHERAGGNPFFALELASAIGDESDPLRPLPIPETLEDLLRKRLASLPASAREPLALVAALGSAPGSLLERAGVPAEALNEAAAANVITREGGTIRFAHPLLSSVLYADLGDERPGVHRRLADLVDDPLLRARHLALSTESPDGSVATALDDTARLASDRGVVAIAAELAEHALRLTPADDSAGRYRRALAAAGAHQAAGEWTRARSILIELLSEAEIGTLRAEALVLLAELESMDRSIELLQEALQDAGSPALRCEIECRLAWATRFQEGLEHTRAAMALADDLGDDQLRSRARSVQVILGWFAGEGETPADLPARAREFAVAVGGDHLVREGTQAVVNTFAPASQRDRARDLFEREYREWSDRDEPRSARALWGLAWVEFWAGNWELAAEHALGAHDISIQYGAEMPQDHLPIAVIAVHSGRLELARQHSQRALELAEEQFTARLHPPQHIAALGLAALWGGDSAAGEEGLTNADRRAAELGWREPSVRWWTGDYAELLLVLGRIDDAVRIIDVWQADATRVGRVWVLAHVTRCRGLVAAARGAVDEAVSLLQDSVDRHDRVGDPYGRSRALLALGVIRRRTRQKRPARDAISSALAGFEQLGAATWATRARAELGRIGGRMSEEGLTPAEQRVAALVAEGRTNREVAATLFLAERTVASHLTHIYAKLGIRSRTELARRLHVGKVQTF
jgi:DNA-binding CsgD family transcriptional regulator